MNIGLIIFTAFNIASAIINIITLKHFTEIEKHIEKKNLPTIVPVAEVKTQFSEEEVQKIRELLKEAKNDVAKLPEADERPCACDHLYSSIILENDVVRNREILVLHCDYCNHEEIIPLKRGVLLKLFMNGGFVKS